IITDTLSAGNQATSFIMYEISGQGTLDQKNAIVTASGISALTGALSSGTTVGGDLILGALAIDGTKATTGGPCYNGDSTAGVCASGTPFVNAGANTTIPSMSGSTAVDARIGDTAAASYKWTGVSSSTGITLAYEPATLTSWVIDSTAAHFSIGSGVNTGSLPSGIQTGDCFDLSCTFADSTGTI